MTRLLIVESPNKVKHIEHHLDDGWQVAASAGHVRDLPQNEMGVAGPDYWPQYVNTERGGAVIARLRKLVQAASEVWLATDPDREGEAIAWHLAQVLERVHSLRSRTPKKAKATICRLVLNLRSQFFQSRLFFSNQEKLRSTTIASAILQNGAIHFVWQSLPPHQSTLVPTKQTPCLCNHPRIFCIAPRLSSSRFNAKRQPFLSVTSAVVTARACGKPCASTAICRLIPLTLHSAHQ